MRPSRVALLSVLLASLCCLLPNGRAASACDASEAAPARAGRPRGRGIKEVVPAKFAARYAEWKREFLSAETGRAQWARFGEDAHFALTLVVTHENPRGAGTGGYRWDDEGRLVAATITVGSRIDEGYPDPIYFPVMNSLTPYVSSRAVGPDILAAAKLAHEFGHLIRTADTDTSLYQLQGQLIPAYNKILLSNGRNTEDERLIELARRMGGTPVEIWQDREYWGEANAMLYLRDRLADENLRCSIFSRIRQSVDLYAKDYDERFISVVRSSPTPGPCGW